MSSFRSRRATRATVLAVALVFPSLPASAADPSASEIVKKMKAALEPPKASIRDMTLTLNQEGESSSFKMIQARKILSDGPRSLTVLTRPDAARGLGYLVQERAGKKDNVEFLYVPLVRRVRRLVPAENYNSFLDSDFTYGDMGFLPMDSTDRLIGSDPVDGKDAWKVESVPGSTVKQWYYSRYFTWIDKTTLLPIRRQFFSPAGEVFKTMTFESVTNVDGVPTPLKITMNNPAAKSSSVLEVTSVTYDAKLDDSLFTPAALSKAADAVDASFKANKKN